MASKSTVAVCALTALLATAPAAAQAAMVAPSLGPQVGRAGVELVRYRGHHHRWRHHHHHHLGRDLAIGLGLGLLGSAIGSQHGYYYNGGDARSRCAASFKSFEWDTGLYTTYGGEKRLCPYL